MLARRALFVTLAALAPRLAAGAFQAGNDNYCEIVDGGACIQSAERGTGGDYWDDMDCKFTPTAGQAIKLQGDFDVQAGSGACEDDYLEIDGTKYCNDDNPWAGSIANPTGGADSIRFFSNSDGFGGKGFKICQYAPPMPPQEPPPPSPPPPAPAPPGTICEDTCEHKNNGVCEDPYGSETQPGLYAYDYVGGWVGSCKVGTDCTDCGKARELCTSCSQECRDRGLRLGHKYYCLEEMFATGETAQNPDACDANCNNRECGHDGFNGIDVAAPDGEFEGDCTIVEAADACRPLQEQANHRLSLPPANRSKLSMLGTSKRGAKVPVEVQILTMQPLVVNLDTGSNLWTLDVDMHLQLRWADSRYKTMPCAHVFPAHVSIDSSSSQVERDDAEEWKKAMWWPNVMVSHKQIDYKLPKTVYGSVFNYMDGYGAEWASTNDGLYSTIISPDGMDYCHDCMNNTMRIKTALDLNDPTPQFGFFPFDTQYFTFTIGIKGSDLFTCEHIFSGMNLTREGLAAVMPTTGEWTPVNVSAGHVDGDKQTCKVTFEVRRNSVIFVIKQVLPSTIVMYAGMSALYMNALDHTGDRTASILVAALILMVNFQADLGLGKITYLVWWDIYNLISIMLLILILCLSLWEKILVDTGETAKATDMNRVQRVSFLFIAYPIVAVWLLLIGLNESYADPLAWTVLVIGLSICLMGSILSYKRIHSAGIRERKAVITQLASLLPTDELFPETLEKAFKAYDVDESGKLDTDELRDLLKAIVTTSDAKLFAEIALAVKGFGDADGCLSYNAFHDALLTVLPKFSGQELNANSELTGAHIAALGKDSGKDKGDNVNVSIEA